MATKVSKQANVIVCIPKRLPLEMAEHAARVAATINPQNHAPVERLARVMRGFAAPRRERIAVTNSRYWHTNGVHLTVGFLDNPEKALRRRIIKHMNAWNKTANVKFVETKTDPQVRIARDDSRENGGYWSYEGTDILSIAPDEATLNLEAFTMTTAESEFHRVVRHEAGHTLGCPHEHMRRELVNKIDRKKAIAYFGREEHWKPDEVIAQVLTPIEEGSLRGTPHADPHSIMCYQIPGSLTKNGKPIIGGLDIDKLDYQFMASIYPKPKTKKTMPKIMKFHSPRRAARRKKQGRRS